MLPRLHANIIKEGQAAGDANPRFFGHACGILLWTLPVHALTGYTPLPVSNPVKKKILSTTRPNSQTTGPANSEPFHQTCHQLGPLRQLKGKSPLCVLPQLQTLELLLSFPRRGELQEPTQTTVVLCHAMYCSRWCPPTARQGLRWHPHRLSGACRY